MKAWLGRPAFNKWIALVCLLTALVVVTAVWATWSAENLAAVGCSDIGNDNFPEIRCEGIFGSAFEKLLSLGLLWAWLFALSVKTISYGILDWLLFVSLPIIALGLLWTFWAGAGAWLWIVRPVLQLFR